MVNYELPSEPAAASAPTPQSSGNGNGVVAGPTAAKRASKTELTGTLRRVLWSAPDATYAIISIASETGEQTVKGPFDADQFKDKVRYRFMGYMAAAAGRYPPAFMADTFTTANPANRGGTIAFLVEYAENVGKKTAERLWDAYGSECIRTLRTNPSAVSAAGIMSADAALLAAMSLDKHVGTEQTRVELYDLLKGRGFPGKLTDILIRKWGATAGAKIRRNPYALLVGGLPGAGFKRCDQMWCDLGHRKDALKRQMVCAWDMIRNDRVGSTWVAASVVAEEIEKQIAGSNVDVVRAFKLGIRARWLAKRRDEAGRLWLAEWERADAERRIAEAVGELTQPGAPVLWPKDLPVSVKDGDGLPTAHQREQGIAALRGCVGLLTGCPGGGKTFSLAFILREIIREHGKGSIAVVSPTGKASVRATESLRRLGIDIRATTIHRLLGIQRAGYDGNGWTFTYRRGNPLPYRFIIVDECSMVESSLMASLLDACSPPSICAPHGEIRVAIRENIPPRCRRCNHVLTNPDSWAIGFGPECAKLVDPVAYDAVGPMVNGGEADVVFPAFEGAAMPGCHVLMIGDDAQLSPVGAGAPFRDLIEHSSEVAASVSRGNLTEIHRNAGSIVQACAAIKDGTFDRFPLDSVAALDELPPRNLKMVECRTENQSLDALDAFLLATRRFHPVRDVQVLCCRNDKGKLCVAAINKRLQTLLNPDGVSAAGNPFRVGDKIICRRNSWNPVVDYVFSLSGETNANNYLPLVVGEDGPPAGLQGDSRGNAEMYLANGEQGYVVAVSEKATIARFGDSEWCVKIHMSAQRAAIATAISQSGDGVADDEPSPDDGEGDGGVGSGNGNGNGKAKDPQASGAQFTLSYAITIHRSQGAEWPCVVFLIDEGAAMLSCRELIYVANSRASKLCILFGRESVLKQQARRVGLVRRKTFLRELLAENNHEKV